MTAFRVLRHGLPLYLAGALRLAAALFNGLGMRSIDHASAGVALRYGAYIPVVVETEPLSDGADVGVAMIGGNYISTVVGDDVKYVDDGAVGVALHDGAYSLVVAEADTLSDDGEAAVALHDGAYIERTITPGRPDYSESGFIGVGLIGGAYIPA